MWIKEGDYGRLDNIVFLSNKMNILNLIKLKKIILYLIQRNMLFSLISRDLESCSLAGIVCAF